MKKALFLVLLLCTPAWAVDAPVLNPKVWSIRIDSAGGGGVWFQTSDADSLLKIIANTRGFGGLKIMSGADSVAIIGSAIVGSTATPTIDADTVFFIGGSGDLDTCRLFFNPTKDSLGIKLDSGAVIYFPAAGGGGSPKAGTVLTDPATAHTDKGIVVWFGTGATEDSLQGVTSGPTFNTSTGVATFNADINLKSGGTIDGNSSYITEVKRITPDSIGTASLQGDLVMAGRFGLLLDTSTTSDGATKRAFIPFDTTTGKQGLPGDNWVPSFDLATSKFVLEAQSGAGTGDNAYLKTDTNATPVDVASPFVLRNYGGIALYRRGASNDTAAMFLKLHPAGGLQLTNDSLAHKLDGSTLTQGASGLKVSTAGLTANELADNSVANAEMADNAVGSAEIAANSVSMSADMNTFTAADLAGRLGTDATGTTTTYKAVFNNGPAITNPTITGTTTSIGATSGNSTTIGGAGATVTMAGNAGAITVQQPTLTLYQTGTPTNEGDIRWDAATDRLRIGTTGGTRYFTGATTDNPTTDSTAASNLGGGAGVYASESGNTLQLRSLLTSTQVAFTQNTNDITAKIPSLAIADSNIATLANINGSKLATNSIPIGSLYGASGYASGDYILRNAASAWTAQPFPTSIALAYYADSSGKLTDGNNRLRVEFPGTTWDTLWFNNRTGGNFWLRKKAGTTYFIAQFDSLIAGYTSGGQKIAKFVDSTTLAINAGAVGVKALGIDNAQLAADAVDGAKLRDTADFVMDSLKTGGLYAERVLKIPTSATPDNKTTEGTVAWSSDADGLNVYDATQATEMFIPTYKTIQMEFVDVGAVPEDCDTMKVYVFDASVFPQGAKITKITLEAKGNVAANTWYFQTWTDANRTNGTTSAVCTMAFPGGTSLLSTTSFTTSDISADDALAVIVPDIDVGNIHLTVVCYAKGD